MKKEKKKRKDEYVGVGGKESVCRKLQEIIIIIIILGVTYSRILKKQKHSNRLAIAAFLKSAAIGPPKKEVTWEALEFLVGINYSRIF